MRHRAKNLRFQAAHAPEGMVILPAPCAVPDAGQASAAPAETIQKPGWSLRTALTLSSYLALPVVAFFVLPEPYTPASMLAAAYAGHLVLNYDAAPADAESEKGK